ncbi:laminin subunit beta-1-like [Mytilus trossulus]|uniref:laminin subunit beta-1-like n=1 Tax=Mytilus trossulus TaxID=6551 RepID=UPI00300492CB
MSAMVPKLLQIIVISLVFQGIVLQSIRQPRCEQGSCYPATGDLLIGREDSLSSTSTCGLNSPERYCIVSHLEEDAKCFVCDSRYERESHNITNIVWSYGNRYTRWWQAEAGKQQVSIQLDLEAEFHFTHLIMTFKTFRPKAMLIERSYDRGNTWRVYRYFAEDCVASFPGVKRWPPRTLEDIICDDSYSDVAPSTEGEVIFRVLPPFIPIEDPYNPKVQDLLKLTNLRVNFTDLHTLGDTLVDNRLEIKEKYYYAMYEMIVRGSCSCYGHASQCVPVDKYKGKENQGNMVHGKCVCTHNTQGDNCERCLDFYSDLPWKPAQQNTPNACQKCNCNNHATECHFDPSVFVFSGEISGGVCDDCQHNTTGRNCQECKEYFFQDPNRDIRDPEICQACDCDPAGSERDGRCDDHTDPYFGLEAGRCRCKAKVEGKRCDSCVDGYWMLSEDNPDGCQICDCNLLGTIDNMGCDKQNGACFCKRFVTGQRCDECYPGYWGLSSDVSGCRPCDCDVGGATSEECDSISGQCTCKPNIIGRKCDQPRSEYFFGKLDYFLYEAEEALGIGNTRPYIREPRPGLQSWTGNGFMQIMEGDIIEFTVNDIVFPMYYDIVIRFDPRMPELWEDINVDVIRSQTVDQTGPCANHRPADDKKTTVLQPGSRYSVVSPAACLEPEREYKIRIKFNSYKTNQATPDATTLIDSIVLTPNIDSIPIFHGIGYPEYMKNEFIRYRCRESQLSVYQPELQDFCRQLTFSISSIIHQKALECQCDPMGSLSSECEYAGGQCRCKPNVVGRRCNKCAPGTYDFGPDGCKPCNCHEYGAVDKFCDARTGQCNCISYVGNKICDQCQAGYWGFPRCRPCQCNGNADTCDDLTGRCDNCNDFTAGDQCDKCLDGYYGDPRINYRIPCRPCLCPGGPTNDVQHADSCYEDPRQQSVVCNCYPGFKGPNCDTCTDNYFGNPKDVNGTCEPCICNNNIDPNIGGSCDTSSGECLKCMFNTEGFNCEQCSPGYYGDATTQNCKQCICDPYGTDPTGGDCDRVTGQCPCLPNVIGQQCDSCAAGFWNITSQVGCSSCGCDMPGSTRVECNQFDGQCDCVQGRGGRDCASCEDNYWGDPTVQCYPCDCNYQGSAQTQCDRRSGQCVCLTGISGYKCDRCDRGTTGVLPNCKPCGDCFNNWDRVIRDLSAQTTDLIKRAVDIKATGVESAFNKEFQQMEENLDEIRQIVRNANISSEDIRDLDSMLKSLRQLLSDEFRRLNNTESQFNARMDDIRKGNNDILSLKQRVEELKKKADDLRRNATDIQARDVEGAFNITKEAQQKSRMAQSKVDGTQGMLNESMKTRAEVEKMLEEKRNAFNQKIQENEAELNEIDDKVSSLGSRIADLNEMVCDGRGDPCDSVCGGGGCGKCGGISCDGGALTKADNAIDRANQAKLLLDIKEVDANTMLTEIQQAQQEAEEAKDQAQMAYNEAMKAKNQTEKAKLMLQNVLSDVQDFLGLGRATPDDVKEITEEVLGMSISLTPDQIIELAQKINETIWGLQNIDSILNATRDDLDKAQKLKERAENAKGDANTILGKAQDVLDNLKGATSAQELATVAINKADADITNAEADLTQIESETSAASEKSDTSLKAIELLKIRLEALRKKYIENDIKVKQAEDAAQRASETAMIAETRATELEMDYSPTASQLDSRYNLTKAARAKAQDLKDRADRLAGETTNKLDKLRKMQEDFNKNEMTLNQLADNIDELNRNMTIYLQVITKKSREYYKCKT